MILVDLQNFIDENIEKLNRLDSFLRNLSRGTRLFFPNNHNCVLELLISYFDFVGLTNSESLKLAFEENRDRFIRFIQNFHDYGAFSINANHEGQNLVQVNMHTTIFYLFVSFFAAQGGRENYQQFLLMHYPDIPLDEMNIIIERVIQSVPTN